MRPLRLPQPLYGVSAVNKVLLALTAEDAEREREKERG
jgi:hypothetical protein